MNFLITKAIQIRVYTRYALAELTNRLYDRNNEGFNFDVITSPSSAQPVSSSLSSLIKEIIGDGFLLAAPKSRRSIERRLTRKHGFGKMILPKNNLIKCDACGHFYPVHAVCGNCYEKVKKETEEMQEAIFKELKLDPIDKEVIVLYEDDLHDDSVIQGKRIVELPKKRPAWFSKNLLVRDSGTRRESDTSISVHQPQPVVKD